MDDRTLEALKGSIEKWQRIVVSTGVDKGAKNCPLCNLFYRRDDLNVNDNCCGCPVAEKTGKKFCINTPYDDWVDYQERQSPSNSGRADTSERLIAARAELAFLESLLP